MAAIGAMTRIEYVLLTSPPVARPKLISVVNELTGRVNSGFAGDRLRTALPQRLFLLVGLRLRYLACRTSVVAFLRPAET